MAAKVDVTAPSEVEAFLGRPATDRSIEIAEIVYFTFRGEQIARIRAAATELDLWLQLGLIPGASEEVLGFPAGPLGGR